jgi:chromate reductase, NAD(P)H dehydrogenase (quinone)
MLMNALLNTGAGRNWHPSDPAVDADRTGALKTGGMVIVGIAGSLRGGSFNAALLRAAAALAPEGCRIEIATIRDFPLYDGDVEAAGIPPLVAELKDRIARADALLLATPEYNQSLPGVFKNAIDWLSRPASDIRRVFGGCPVGLMGATSGAGGTRLAQTAWLPVLRALGARPWFGQSLFVPNASHAFDAAGQLVDEKLNGLVMSYVGGLTAFARLNQREPRSA